MAGKYDWMDKTGPGKRESAYTEKPKKKKKRGKRQVSGAGILGGITAEAAGALQGGRYKYK